MYHPALLCLTVVTYFNPQGAVHPTPALPMASFLAIVILAAGFFLHSSLSPGNSRPAGLPLLIAFFMGPILFRTSPAWADLVVAGLAGYGIEFSPSLAYQITHVSTPIHRGFPCSFTLIVRSEVSTNFTFNTFLPKNHSRKSRISQDFLLPNAQHVLHAGANAIRRMDK
jgi:hypothetical protein